MLFSESISKHRLQPRRQIRAWFLRLTTNASELIHQLIYRQHVQVVPERNWKNVCVSAHYTSVILGSNRKVGRINAFTYLAAKLFYVTLNRWQQEVTISLQRSPLSGLLLSYSKDEPARVDNDHPQLTAWCVRPYTTESWWV